MDYNHTTKDSGTNMFESDKRIRS